MRDAGDADDGPPSGKDQVLLKKTGRIIQKSSLFKKASTPIAIPTTPVILRQTQPLMGIRPDAIPDQLLAVAVEKEKGSMYNRNNLNQEIKKSPIKNNAPSPSSGATIDSNAKRQKTDNSLEQDSEEKISHVRENKKILDKISGEILETDLVKVPKVLKTVLPFKTNATRMIPPSLTRSSAKLITTAAEARKSLIRNEISVEPKKLIPSTKLDLSIHNRGSRSHQSKDESKISEELPEHTNRAAAGNEWTDATLADWDPNDYRIFVGGLGPDVRDSILHAAFSPFGSITKARVIFNKKTGRSRCYGFVGFKDPQDFLRAMREMNGKYIGNRPVSLKRSDWKERARHDKCETSNTRLLSKLSNDSSHPFKAFGI